MLKKRVDEDVKFLQEKLNGFIPEVAIILGSGLGAFADEISADQILAYEDIPHFSKTSVAGHKGRLVYGEINEKKVMALQGRFHYYEGHPMAQVVHPIRVMLGLGIKSIILTNAAGGINQNMKPGDLMIISDHLNLMGNNPLLGTESLEFGVRFPDMSRVYHGVDLGELKNIIDKEKSDICLHQGVYGAVTGPCYETPAEIRMFAALGVDAIGMSTVPEAIAAKHGGAQVVGISCITNMGAGIQQTALNHDEVKETAQKSEKIFSLICKHVISQL